MNNDQFEWDGAKYRRNYRDHGVTFETARNVFADAFRIEVLDEREDYGEDRWRVIGVVEGQMLSVVYTERRGRYRLISARRAEKDEQDHYFTQNSQGEA